MQFLKYSLVEYIVMPIPMLGTTAVMYSICHWGEEFSGEVTDEISNTRHMIWQTVVIITQWEEC